MNENTRGISAGPGSRGNTNNRDTTSAGHGASKRSRSRHRQRGRGSSVKLDLVEAKPENAANRVQKSRRSKKAQPSPQLLGPALVAKIELDIVLYQGRIIVQHGYSATPIETQRMNIMAAMKGCSDAIVSLCDDNDAMSQTMDFLRNSTGTKNMTSFHFAVNHHIQVMDIGSNNHSPEPKQQPELIQSHGPVQPGERVNDIFNLDGVKDAIVSVCEKNSRASYAVDLLRSVTGAKEVLSLHFPWSRSRCLHRDGELLQARSLCATFLASLPENGVFMRVLETWPES